MAFVALGGWTSTFLPSPIHQQRSASLTSQRSIVRAKPSAKSSVARIQMSLLPLDPTNLVSLHQSITTIAESTSASTQAAPSNLNSLGITAVVWFLTFWGLISFVKGSTKPRIEQHNYSVEEQPDSIAKKTLKHFTSRAYKVNPNADKRVGVVTFEGLVSPSVFLASLLAGCLGLGFSSLVVILNTFLPEDFHSPYWWNLVWLSFAVVPWYWNGAKRIEQVKLMIEDEGQGASKVFIKGHRDEILEFERALGYTRNAEE